MTRQEKFQAVVEWTQGMPGADRDLFEEIVGTGIQALVEAKLDGHVGAGRFVSRDTHL